MPRACGVGHRLGRLGHQPGGGAGVVPVAVHQRYEAAAGDQLHREVVLALMLADLVDRDDAGVVEQRDGLGLVLEAAELGVAGEQAGPDHLQGHRAVERDLAGLVDDAHAAAAQLAPDLVIAEVADGGAAWQAVTVGAVGAGGGEPRRGRSRR